MTTDRQTQYREYLEDCGAPTVVQLRETIQRAAKDYPGIPKGTVYFKWVGLVDGEFTVDRYIPWEDEA